MPLINLFSGGYFMERPLKPVIMSHSGSYTPEPDYSKIENDKPTPTIISMSPEYPKYRDALIIGGVILLLAVFVGGLYLLARHKDWSVRKLVGGNWSSLYAGFHNNRGLTYYKKGQYEKAISAFTKAIEINPTDERAYSTRGLAYAGKSQYDKAISDINKALEINPSDAEAYNNLAWILATCPDAKYRDGTEAAELAQKSVDLVQHSQNLDTLAAAYAEAGKFEHAITTQEKAIAQLKKEGDAKKLIDEFIEHLNSYRNHKPWREKPKTMKE